MKKRERGGCFWAREEGDKKAEFILVNQGNVRVSGRCNRADSDGGCRTLGRCQMVPTAEAIPKRPGLSKAARFLGDLVETDVAEMSADREKLRCSLSGWGSVGGSTIDVVPGIGGVCNRRRYSGGCDNIPRGCVHGRKIRTRIPVNVKNN